jgi:predicted nucleic acid-binding protein
MLGGVTRLVIDSSAWISYFRRDGSEFDQAVAAAIEETDIVLPDLVLLEVMRGFPTPQLAKQARRVFDNLIKVEIAGFELARNAYENHRRLREKGTTVRGTIDLLIGAWCIANDVALLHNDRDFDVMERHLRLRSVISNSLR